jgi:hypothetical protein
MAQTAERPPTPQAEGGPEASLRGGTDSLPNKRNPPSAQAQNPVAVAAAIADLTIECAVEAAHIAWVAARYFVEQMELGDLWAAEHSLRVAVAHMREAAAKFRQWQALAGPRP